MKSKDNYDHDEILCRDITITYRSDEFFSEFKHVLGLSEDNYENIILPTKEFAGVIKK